MPDHYRIGLLFSSTGPYSVIGRSMMNGALLAIEEVRDVVGINLQPVCIDPEGVTHSYAGYAAELLTSGIRHVVGCYTSSSRKEVIPEFEKRDGLLWYPSHYEGFESSSNVVYTGAAPNQHIVPLIDFLVSRYGNRAFCAGSNYIWAWENNRIMREGVVARGGQVLAERYLALGDLEIEQIVEAVIQARPSFVFSTLIGTSAYQFLRHLRAGCAARGIDQRSEIPVASCTLSEPELFEIGLAAMDGHISSSVYFSTASTPENAAFVKSYAEAYPDEPHTSADAEAAYIAVHLLARAIKECGTDDVAAVKNAVPKIRFSAPQGTVTLDPATLHSFLTPRIGVSSKEGNFDILYEAPIPLAPDPYLVGSAPRYALQHVGRNLKVVPQ